MLAFTTTQWAQIAAPVLAALAACASWAAVRQSRRAFETSLLPRLEGEWIDLDDGTVTLEIYNTGAGFAREPYFHVRGGTAGQLREAEGRVLPAGPLRPGQMVRLNTELPRSTGNQAVTGVLFCLDVADRWHVWSWQGRHGRPRNLLGRSPRKLGARRALNSMYPQCKRMIATEVDWEIASTSSAATSS